MKNGRTVQLSERLEDALDARLDREAAVYAGAFDAAVAGVLALVGEDHSLRAAVFALEEAATGYALKAAAVGFQFGAECATNTALLIAKRRAQIGAPMLTQ